MGIAAGFNDIRHTEVDVVHKLDFVGKGALERNPFARLKKIIARTKKESILGCTMFPSGFAHQVLKQMLNFVMKESLKELWRVRVMLFMWLARLLLARVVVVTV